MVDKQDLLGVLVNLYYRLISVGWAKLKWRRDFRAIRRVCATGYDA